MYFIEEFSIQVEGFIRSSLKLTISKNSFRKMGKSRDDDDRIHDDGDDGFRTRSRCRTLRDRNRVRRIRDRGRGRDRSVRNAGRPLPSRRRRPLEPVARLLEQRAASAALEHSTRRPSTQRPAATE